MAFYTNTLENRPATSGVARIAAAVANVFVRIMAAQTRTGEVDRLQKLSDAELQALGLRRDQIMRQVYRDVYAV